MENISPTWFIMRIESRRAAMESVVFGAGVFLIAYSLYRWQGFPRPLLSSIVTSVLLAIVFLARRTKGRIA